MMMPLVFRLICAGMVMAVLVAGCARTPSGDRTLQHLRHQTEARLLQDARVAFFQGKYQEAVLLLDRFLANHHSSRLVDEARWWLARAQQQQGDLHAALSGYRQLAQSRHKNPFRDEAQLRVAELESFLGVNHESQELVGAIVGVTTLVQPNGLNRVKNYHRQTTATAIIIDVPCRVPRDEGTAETSPPPVRVWSHFLQEKLTPLLMLGKEQGFGVWVGVPLRCLGSYYDASEAQIRRWRDQSYNVRSGQIETSDTFSLFSAEYRDIVFSLLSQIGGLRVDGILFRATAAPGPYEGLTTLALRGFEEQFGEPLLPEVLFSSVPQGTAASSRPKYPQRVSMAVDFPQQFWRWSGWKAREGIRFMNELAVHLRSQFPFLRIGVEVHAESIENPVSALINVSEDWIETSQGEFDVLVSNATEFPTVSSQPGWEHSTGSDGAARISALVTGMVEYLGRPARVWVILPGEAAQLMNNGSGGDLLSLPNGVGVFYDFTVVP